MVGIKSTLAVATSPGSLSFSMLHVEKLSGCNIEKLREPEDEATLAARVTQ